MRLVECDKRFRAAGVDGLPIVRYGLLRIPTLEGRRTTEFSRLGIDGQIFLAVLGEEPAVGIEFAQMQH